MELSRPADLTRPIGGNPSPDSWLRLVVLQPSPFCNIDCDYCYLPGRTQSHRMDFETLRRTIAEIFSSDLVGRDVTFVWHAGEPLAVPIAWYEEAFKVIRETAPPEVRIVHTVQSNGTLITDAWCEFLRRHDVHVGLSIDGPDFVHDAHRRTRRGSGTHAAAMRGAERLRAHGIDYHVIAVVTAEALDHADAIYDFFVGNGIFRFGFNIEEMEGAHPHSSLESASEDRVTAFFRRIFERQKADRGRVRVREFDGALQRILAGQGAGAERFVYENEQVRPFGILSVDWQGNFSTWSPELLGLSDATYGDFNFGNVLTGRFLEAIATPKFQEVLGAIQAGVERCRAECGYFGVCGGGAPANKYFENGSFDSTSTLYCRYSVKVPTELVLADLERETAINSPR